MGTYVASVSGFITNFIVEWAFKHCCNIQDACSGRVALLHAGLWKEISEILAESMFQLHLKGLFCGFT